MVGYVSCAILLSDAESDSLSLLDRYSTSMKRSNLSALYSGVLSAAMSLCPASITDLVDSNPTELVEWCSHIMAKAQDWRRYRI